MIKDYVDILSKNNLYLFTEKGGLYTHSYPTDRRIADAYYNMEFTYPDSSKDRGYDIIKFPYNVDEVMTTLINLNVFVSDFEWDANAGQYSIRNMNFEKLNLLYQIFYNNPNKGKIQILNNIVFVINQEHHININSVRSFLDIDDKNISFNDIEIFIHAVGLKYPEITTSLILHLRKISVQNNSKVLLDQILKIKLKIGDKSIGSFNISNDPFIFLYEKREQKLYIKHHIEGEFLIKKLEFNSDYELVARYMNKSDIGIIYRKEIEKRENKPISESLAQVKKHLNFNNILNKVFFNGASKDTLDFNKIITKSILQEKNIEEEDVLNYLIERFKRGNLR